LGERSHGNSVLNRNGRVTNTSMIYPQYWDVEDWNQLFFRLQVTP